MEPTWKLLMEKWGTQKEKDAPKYAQKKRCVTKRNCQHGKRPTTAAETQATTRTDNCMERCIEIPTRAQEGYNILKQTYNLPWQTNADVQSIKREKTKWESQSENILTGITAKLSLGNQYR